MMYFLVSILLGAIPDVLYYYLYIAKIKQIKSKRIILFILMFLNYIIFNMILRYNLYLYLLYDIMMFMFIKLLYKSEINDFFLVLFIDIYYIFLSSFCFFLIPNYAVALLASKIFMFLPLIYKNKIINLYKSYCKMWNRNDNAKYPIKSLTLRNISLVLLNIIIFITDILLIYLSLKNS